MMRRAARLLAVLLILTPTLIRAETPAAEPLPKAEELHKLYVEKQYGPLLQKLARVLRLRGDAARPYDMVDLNMLKGDTHLQLKEQSLAVTAFNLAVKAIDEQTEPKQAAVAKATVMLMKKSHSYTFTPRLAPKGQVPQPISIVEPEKRTACFTAMFEDARLEGAAKIRAAKTSKTLAPIVEAINSVADLRILEMAAFGKEDQSAAQLEGLALQAKDLMTRAVKDLKDRAAKDHELANNLLPVPVNPNQGPTTPTFYKKGLQGNLIPDLKQIIVDCDKIAEAARQFADVSKAAADGFGEVKSAAEKVGKSAKDTLEDDYTGVFTK